MKRPNADEQEGRADMANNKSEPKRIFARVATLIEPRTECVIV